MEKFEINTSISKADWFYESGQVDVQDCAIQQNNKAKYISLS